MIKQFIKVASCILLTVSVTSCAHLKEYQKSRLNDSEMALSNRKVEKNELNFQSYREALRARTPEKLVAGAGAIELNLYQNYNY